MFGLSNCVNLDIFPISGAGAQGCDCNATVVGSILTKGIELLFFNFCISSLWHQGKSPALSCTAQHAMPRKILREMWETERLNTLFSFLPSAYHSACRIQPFYSFIFTYLVYYADRFYLIKVDVISTSRCILHTGE